MSNCERGGATDESSSLRFFSETPSGTTLTTESEDIFEK